MRGSFLSGPVVQDIVLKDAHGAIIGQIDEIRLSYDLLALMRLRLTVHEIDIVAPRLTIIQEPDGVLNISRVLSSAQPRSPTLSLHRAPDSPSGSWWRICTSAMGRSPWACPLSPVYNR